MLKTPLTISLSLAPLVLPLAVLTVKLQLKLELARFLLLPSHHDLLSSKVDLVALERNFFVGIGGNESKHVAELPSLLLRLRASVATRSLAERRYGSIPSLRAFRFILPSLLPSFASSSLPPLASLFCGCCCLLIQQAHLEDIAYQSTPLQR